MARRTRATLSTLSTLSTRARIVAMATTALLATAATATASSNLRGWTVGSRERQMSEACVTPCASLHRTTATCDPLINGSVTTTCGKCLPGFDGSDLPFIPCVVNEAYWTGDYADFGGFGDDGDNESDKRSHRPAMGMQGAIGSAFGSLVVVLMCVITWRGWFDCCCSRKRKREPLRAFLEPTTKEWTCAVCLHTNSSLRRYCVMCKSEFNNKEVDAEASVTSTAAKEEPAASDNCYVLVETPRANGRTPTRPFMEVETQTLECTEDQRLASARLEWKRCLDKHTMRWMRFEAQDVRRVPALQGTIVRIKDIASLELFKASGVQSTASVTGFFVVHDSQAVKVWHPVEHAVFNAHPYKQWRSLHKIASMPFDDRLRWFHQQLLKLRHPMREQLFTIHVHRQNVLKQTMQLFQTTPATTLRRHLRVDFMDEPGIDGGGILREWLQLVCKELFSDALGLFKRTASGVDSGYWIHRTSTRKSTSQRQMYKFFGMFLAKSMLEGLVVNVRLSTPLLKHLLGSPLSIEDLRFLDDQIYSSVCYLLAHDKVEDLGLTFCVADRDLISRGSEVAVTDDNKRLYVDHLVQYYLFDSVEDELSDIVSGFRSILPTTPLHIFDYKELDLVISGLAEIDVLDWQAHTNVGLLGHDVQQEQQLVDWFWEIVEELDQRCRSRLLQYVTGSSGVPVEGFAALTSLDGQLQPFTIQLTDIAAKTYSTLPYASTCFNRLDLPAYEAKSDLKQMMMLLVETDVTGFNRR